MHDLHRRVGGTIDGRSSSENLAMNLDCFPQPRSHYREKDKSPIVFHRPMIYALDDGKTRLRMVLTPTKQSILNEIINNT